MNALNATGVDPTTSSMSTEANSRMQSRDPVPPFDDSSNLPLQSLAALMRDIQGLQSQNQTLSEQLWQSGSTVHNLSLQVNQLNARAVQSEEAMHQARDKINQLLLALDTEKEQRIAAKQCLESTSLRDGEIERHYAHVRDMNRCFLSLIDRLKISRSGENLQVLLPEDVQIGSLLQEHNDMKHELVAKERQLADSKRKDQEIQDLRRENEAILETLESQKREISTLEAELREVYSDEGSEDEETCSLGKRKRCEEDGA